MVRFRSILVTGITGCTALMPTSAWAQQPRPATPPPTQLSGKLDRVPPTQVSGAAVPLEQEWAAIILGPALPKLEPAELAGMAPGTDLTVFPLAQAYAQTLLRAHTPAAERAANPLGILDPKRLDGQVDRLGNVDFDRFRREFFSNGFRDPAPRYFTVFKHRQAVEAARGQVALANNLRVLFEELIQGQAAGVSRLQLDELEHSLLLYRQTLADELTSYRSAADEFKVSLGLPPGTSLVLDESMLGPFTTVFLATDAWQRSPKHVLTELPVLHDRLPRLEDVKIGAWLLRDVVQGNLCEEPFLQTAVEVARTHRPTLKNDQAGLDDRNASELRIRTLVRNLILIHKNYDLERKRPELALRDVDHWFDQLIAPPAGGTSALAQSANAVPQATRVMEAQTRLCQSRMRLVTLWLQYKEQALELYRELGTMPYDNWEAFYRSFVPSEIPLTTHK
jgi:hypothetical protein